MTVIWNPEVTKTWTSNQEGSNPESSSSISLDSVTWRVTVLSKQRSIWKCQLGRQSIRIDLSLLKDPRCFNVARFVMLNCSRTGSTVVSLTEQQAGFNYETKDYLQQKYLCVIQRSFAVVSYKLYRMTAWHLQAIHWQRRVSVQGCNAWQSQKLRVSLKIFPKKCKCWWGDFTLCFH